MLPKKTPKKNRQTLTPPHSGEEFGSSVPQILTPTTSSRPTRIATFNIPETPTDLTESARLKGVNELEKQLESTRISPTAVPSASGNFSGIPFGVPFLYPTVPGLTDDIARGWTKPLQQYDNRPIKIPKNIPKATHELQKEYLDYLKERKGRTETDSALEEWIEKNKPKFPFGATKRKIPKSDETELLAIQGPVDWTDLYKDFKSIGDDFRIPIERDKQLLQTKIDELNESQQKLKDIKFIKQLGSGNYGTVWKVRAIKINLKSKITFLPLYQSKQVELACKVVRLDPQVVDAYAPDQFQEFLDNTMKRSILGDMLALRTLKHENICKMVDVIHIPDSKTGFPFAAFCLFMQLCDGDLHSLIKSSANLRLSEDQSKHWFKQMADGVQYLHLNNVVNLDIKPKNILYIYSGTKTKSTSVDTLVMNSSYKLCDFGMAIAFPPDDNQCLLTGTIRFGTRQYQAQEMYQQNASVATKPCDIHCLGASLTESLLGEDFIANQYQIKGFVNFGKLPKSANLSQNVTQIIKGMTDLNPKNRLKIEKVLSHPWLQ